jgi:6-phosphogluconate dehydrogenase-like protein
MADVEEVEVVVACCRSAVDTAMRSATVDVEHDEWAVLEHDRDVRATPPLRRGLDERPPLLWIGDNSRGRRNVSNDGLLQVHHHTRVSSDVIDPVPRPVRTWHPGDKQQAIPLMQEDLNPPTPSRPSPRRRQINDLTTKQRRADARIHGLQRFTACIARGAGIPAPQTDLDAAISSDTDAVLSIAVHQGMLAALAPGAVWAQMSTIGVAGIDRVAEIVARERPDVMLLDAPVSGSKEPAERGELTIFASGADQTRARVAPLFDAIGEHTRRPYGRVTGIAAHQDGSGVRATITASSSGIRRTSIWAGVRFVPWDRLTCWHHPPAVASTRKVPGHAAET